MKKFFFLLFALLPLCASAQGANLGEHIGMEGVPMWTSIVYGKLDEFTPLETGIYPVNYGASHDIDRNGRLIDCDASGGTCYYDGRIYACEYDDEQSLQKVTPHWCIYDAKTRQKLSDIPLADNFAATTISLAYDPTSHKIYGILKTYMETYLVSVDPETGDMQRISDDYPRTDIYLALACSPDGVLFATYLNEESYDGDQTLYLVRLRKSDGKAALIGQMHDFNLFAGDIPYNMKYAQAMCFNNANGHLYWMFDSSSVALSQQYTPIFEVNTSNADMTLVAYLKPMYMMSGLFFVEPNFSAPAIATDFTYNAASDEALHGSLAINLPTTTYRGQALSGPLTLTLREQDNVVFSATGEPGEHLSSEDMNFSAGLHTLTITVTNDYGDSPAITRTFYVGYDVPGRPQQVVLSNDENVAHLSWTAPQYGANGAPINSANLTYEVTRYPGAVLVAQGLRDTHFSERLSEYLGRYCYTVKACDGDRKGSAAQSNDCIIGLALEPPYEADFSTVDGLTDYFTFIDHNEDGTSWSYIADFEAAYYAYNINNAADDYLISPPLCLQPEQSYTLSFDACSYYKDYPERLEVLFGTGRTPEALHTTLLSVEKVPSAETADDIPHYEVTLPTFVGDEQVCYFAFHCISDAYMGILLLRNIAVKPANPESSSHLLFEDNLPAYDLQGRRLHYSRGLQIINHQKILKETLLK